MSRRKVKRCHSERRGRWEEGGKDEEQRRERGEPDTVKVRGKMQKDKVIVIQWNLSIAQTLLEPK